jgi:hypothetical protein
MKRRDLPELCKKQGQELGLYSQAREMVILSLKMVGLRLFILK